MSIKPTKRTRRKPAKAPAPPYPEYPLRSHPLGYWIKKIKGRVYYFGKWDDPQGALQRYLDQRDDLYAGREPRPINDALTVRDLVNRFLTAKEAKAKGGELSTRTFQDYHAAAGRVVATLGPTRAVSDLRPDDFARLRSAIAKTSGPVTLANSIQRVRTIFKWGFDSGLLEKPMRFGPDFVKPSKRMMRLARHAAGARMFTAPEIRLILSAASGAMPAMVMLAINCGWGNHDVATVPLSAFDFDRGVVNFPRPKTGIERRSTLWPETIEAIKDYLERRPKPDDPADADCLFVTKYRRRFVRMNDSGAWVDGVGQEFGKVLRSLKLDRPRLGFYTIRHTFATIAGETRDQPAVNRIMGHDDPTMAGVYREWRKDRREDDRLRKVTDYVRAWLFVVEAGT